MKKTFSKNEIPAIAREVLSFLKADSSNLQATVIALSGDLGAGKTTLTQAIARELGITENVISPTFIIMKRYPVVSTSYSLLTTNLVHIDAYRLDSHKELEKLGWAEIISNPENLVLIEWPERVSEIIPKSAHKISLIHKNDEEREMEY
ncbi:MAG: tRNA (adenosine(37)-N6)-threonylcarbamoyltransferase complex ATPase subunit type 1 TsaE [Candidatus Pacebacteria bacterium]|nr:tRNA (adenosine(37)-N6)-threonylcarbamoyltransferase complex ATPase subunit type 1 TsaE [Candidatus Paceibacterota bacterium]